MAFDKKIIALCSGAVNNRVYFSGDDITWLSGEKGYSEEIIVNRGLGKIEYAPVDKGNYRETVFALVGGFSDGKMFEAGDDISFLTLPAEGRDAIPARRLVETGLGRIGYVEIPLAPEPKKKENKEAV